MGARIRDSSERNNERGPLPVARPLASDMTERDARDEGLPRSVRLEWAELYREMSQASPRMAERGTARASVS